MHDGLRTAGDDNNSSMCVCRYEAGRPVFTLTGVQMVISLQASEISLQFSLFLTVDAGNLKDGSPDACSYLPTGSTAYQYLEPITFKVLIRRLR